MRRTCIGEILGYISKGLGDDWLDDGDRAREELRDPGYFSVSGVEWKKRG